MQTADRHVQELGVERISKSAAELNTHLDDQAEQHTRKIEIHDNNIVNGLENNNLLWALAKFNHCCLKSVKVHRGISIRGRTCFFFSLRYHPHIQLKFSTPTAINNYENDKWHRTSSFSTHFIVPRSLAHQVFCEGTSCTSFYCGGVA